MNTDKFYQIALTLVSNVGDVAAKKLLAYCGSAENIFKESRKSLMSIPGIGAVIANSILSQKSFATAELEMHFIEKNNVTPLFFSDEAYPFRLKQCADAPMMLFKKGAEACCLNATKILSVVGTRSASEYGKAMTDTIVEGLSHLDDLLVVSGLAYGIDVAAHKASLKYDIPTLGVLAHGIDRLYPSMHTQLSRQMQETGALLTECRGGIKPERENFPKRNRIISGISDATLVVEARQKGGALITADIANSYNRDVFAVPGRVGDQNSEGCNQLIRRNQAALVQSARDICYLMGWDAETNKKEVKPIEQRLDLNEYEANVLGVLNENGKATADQVATHLKLPISEIMYLLFQLEIKGLIKALAGNQYSKS
ncbi:MAG: DNA-protecting protein DprA [Bacteroidetes bacterium MED-G21]|nr:MAG: DNA-protecting protein DprA [Bacteroidetes bacterium MED-G21]